MAQGRARLAMGSGLSAWVLEAPGGFGDAGFHAHHALQLTFGLHGTLALECAQGGAMLKVTVSSSSAAIAGAPIAAVVSAVAQKSSLVQVFILFPPYGRLLRL